MKQVIAGLVAVILIVGCSDNPTEPDPPEEVRQLTTTEQELVSSGNTFGLELYHELVLLEPDTNLFLSPLSVAMALGMTYNGARNETQAAMAEVLQLEGMDLEEVNKSYQSLIALLRGLDNKVDFNLANSIWYRDDFAVEPEFIDLNSTYFDAQVSALDFGDPGAPAIINGWVDQQTDGKIDRIVEVIPPEVVMYLINAIYFKADWSQPFDKDATSVAPFTKLDGSTVDCQMMQRQAGYHYYRGEGFRLVNLPYGDSLYSMTIILPDSETPLAEIEAELTSENLDLWLSSAQITELNLGLPKFESAYGLSLAEVLKLMGMEIAFDPSAADFTGINAGGGLFINDVVHKTYVKVDEEGTEAAAATSVEIGFTSLPPSFRADHPFIYMIRENNSGTVLFIGKLTEPHWSEKGG